MSKPLTNDFDMPISRDTARRTLEAAGWQKCAYTKSWTLCGHFEIGYSLARAWEIHKRGET